MKAARIITLGALAFAQGACSPVPSNECTGMSRAEAVQLAREQKHALLRGSTASERDNFASDAVSPAEGHGFVDVVGFKGKDGRTLVALIYDDCLVGFTYQ